MASRKPKQTTTTAKSMKASTGAGVAKRSHKKLRFHENGLLNVETKTGKYLEIARQNQQDSPLLRLPPELRHLIFSHVIGGKTFEILYDRSGPYRSPIRERLSSKVPKRKFIAKNITVAKNTLALLVVCRQIYAETALLPFSSNTFSASRPDNLKMWIKRFPPAVSEAITSIQLDAFIRSSLLEHWVVDVSSIPQYKRLSSNLSSLKRVKLNVLVTATNPDKISKKQLKRGWQFMKGLYEAENSEVKVTRSG
ncbi:uncharacterized protein J4E88_004399 [Alternaria novae-zelandiae]|uniref:uncharacterized protein n=1 Tax=Alternaria novae-zelandiae TaxID=430562 RepID=UPI0020C40DF3|nr:uncharacterized protein J4E88_004399 [Alternaria novae-zelandiae]KAI4684957.1 hypothetical protein J4E88_004399 [Alternaria novae-zelandiae]